jgi:hypothetical protein
MKSIIIIVGLWVLCMIVGKFRSDKMKAAGMDCVECGKHIKPAMHCPECGRLLPTVTGKHWMVAGAVLAMLGYFSFTEYMAVAVVEFGGASYGSGLYDVKPEYFELARVQGILLVISGIIVFVKGYLKKV